MGAVNCSKAVWQHMITQNYGRILMTTSASGIYGNFGQANYAAAKSALVGLMNVLGIEGRSKGIHVNALAPLATTHMTESIFDATAAEILTPGVDHTRRTVPGVHGRADQDDPRAGGGTFAVSRMLESQGVFLPADARTPDDVARHWPQISDSSVQSGTDSTTAQIQHFVDSATRAGTVAR